MIRNDGDLWMPANKVAGLMQGGGDTEEFSFHWGVTCFSGGVESSAGHDQSPLVWATQDLDISIINIQVPCFWVLAGDLV